MGGLKCLNDYQARALARYKGDLYMENLDALSSELYHEYATQF